MGVPILVLSNVWVQRGMRWRGGFHAFTGHIRVAEGRNVIQMTKLLEGEEVG